MNKKRKRSRSTPTAAAPQAPKPSAPAEYQPRGMIDRERRICIEVARNSGGIHFIEFETAGLTVQREPAAVFDRRFKEELTPSITKYSSPKALAARLLDFAERCCGADAEALAHLRHIAETGEALKEMPKRETPAKPLPEALKAHQFKSNKPDGFKVTLTESKAQSKLLAGSLRQELVDWLKSLNGKCATIDQIEERFKRNMRGIITKLQEKSWITCS